MSGLHSDHPTIVDLLDRTNLLLEVGNSIRECKPPHVIGIYGDWGSGKTSFLKRLQLYLYNDADEETHKKHHGLYDPYKGKQDEQPNTTDFLEAKAYCETSELDTSPDILAVVWFDAWSYQGETSPIVALLHEIRRKFSTGARIRQFMVKAVSVAADSVLQTLEPISKAISFAEPTFALGASLVSNAKKAGAEYEQRRFEVPLTTDQIREQLKYAVDTVLSELKDANDEGSIKKWFRKHVLFEKEVHDRRLVVIIDDLDRCEPETAVRLLEGIKVYMNIPNCVFVLGVNEQRLTEHIAAVYQKTGSVDGNSSAKCLHAAKDYLGKIVSSHYTMGIARDVSKMVADSFIGFSIPSLDEKQNIDLSTKVKQILIETECLPPNPRRIKAFLNTLHRYSSNKKLTDPIPELLIIFAYLAEFHPSVARKVQYHTDYWGALVAWCSAEKYVVVDEKSGIRREIPDEFDGFVHIAGYASAAKPEAGTIYPDPIIDNVLHVEPLIKSHKEWYGKGTIRKDSLNKMDVNEYHLLG